MKVLMSILYVITIAMTLLCKQKKEDLPVNILVYIEIILFCGTFCIYMIYK